MANTITKQTIVDGPRHTIVHCHINGDGTGDESSTLLIDASTYTPAPTTFVLEKVDAQLIGFTIELEWDATANVDIINVSDYDSEMDLRQYGGIANNAGAGITGDIDLTTVGLGAGDHGTLILQLRKKF